MFDHLQHSLQNMNENKVFVGTIMMILTIGGRFIIDEFNDSQKKAINNKTLRRLFMFCVFFASTRDILTAITLTVIFSLVVMSIIDSEEDTVEEGLVEIQQINKQKITDIQKQLQEIQISMR
jgi:quinol-cytochrome oxidoreductase complex cytochrome b subunit